MRLECKNLVIRDYMESDPYNYLSLYSDKETTKYIKDEYVEDLDSAIKILKEKTNKGFYAITMSNISFIGEVMIIEVKKGVYELGITLKSEYFRRGYASIIYNTLMDYLSLSFGAYNFVTYVEKNNIPYIEFIKSLGFIEKGNTNNKMIFEI